eukprot:15360187-Ditylum_brightwellii.AAC.1
MKQYSALWSTLLWLTGGLLELNNPGPTVAIDSADKNTTATIKHKTIYDLHKILGHNKHQW